MATGPKQSVASELLVNDRTLVVPVPPFALTTSGDLVWIALSDGKVEVRNARTGEVVRRFEPALTTGKTEGAEPAPRGGATVSSNSAAVPPNTSSVSGIPSSLGNRLPPGTQPALVMGIGAASASILKKHNEDIPAPSPVQVRTLLAVPTADGSTNVWLGLSNGALEVHEGGDLLHSSVGIVSATSSSSFVAVLRVHTAAVTCLAEFGGYVYSGSEDQRIAQWRAASTSFVGLFASPSPHQGAVRCLYAEGNAVISGADDCTVKVWDVGESAMRLTGYFHSRSGGVLSLCRVGELMWSGDAAGQVVRWHIRTCEAVSIHTPHKDRVLSLCHVGDRVYSGSADGTMGIFSAESGQLLQHITDQEMGWVTAVVCPAELSRFVVWSTSADGAVRCWYQDEYVNMTSDEMHFNDPSWYESGSTPYREFRAAVGQRMNRLKRQLEAMEQRDPQTMALLRCCSTVFGGGGPDFEEQQRRLQEQLGKAEERCGATEARLAQKRDTVGQLDRDIAATLALLQAAKNELNLLVPGEADRILATLPAVNADDLVPYGQAPPPSSSSALAAPSTHAASTAVPPGPPSVLPPLSPPPIAAPTATATTTAVPLPPPAATTSTLGVGGPLSAAPPPAPPVSAAPLPSELTTAANPSTLPTTTTAAAAAPAPAPAPAEATVSPQPAISSPPEAESTGASAAATAPVVDSVNWTNPHVGNYIQRRYYGALPSLRTIDLMKQERRRGRLPRVKVEPLQRGRSHSATAAKSRTASTTEKKSAVTTTAKSTTTTTTTATAATAPQLILSK